MNTEQFIEKLAKYANKYASQFGIKIVSPIIAQGLLESNHGKSYKAQFHNYHGLKYRANRVSCNSGYFEDGGSEQNADGSYTLLPKTTSWYAFDTFEMGVLGYFQFTNISRYSGIKGETDPKKFLQILKDGDYATSHDYVKNTYNVIKKYDLEKYDNLEGLEMSEYLVAIDDGHGMETAGKRSPVLDNGIVMRENEFNRTVSDYLETELKRCGFDTLMVAPTDADTPLSTRVSTANNAKADIYVSIHANAYDGTFEGHNPEGLELFYHTGSINGKKLAEEVYTQLLQGTPQISRGLKSGNHLQVINSTKMPAILIEAGFMDNPREIKLLMDDSFRREVAKEAAIGICNYFEMAYVKEDVANPDNDNAEPVKLHRVQVGAFQNKANAERLSQELKNKGYNNFITS